MIILFLWLLSILSLLGLIIGAISKIPLCLIYVPYLALFKDADFFTFSAVLVAAITVLYQSYKSTQEKSIDDSKFYLDKYIQGCELVLNRLNADTPSRRIAWVSAASIAKKVKNLEKKIIEQPDIDFLEIYQRNFAHLIIEFIKQKQAKYYYGSDDSRDMDEAYQESYNNQFNTSAGLVPRIKGPSYIDEQIILEVISIIEPIWMKESDIKWKNKDEFLNVIKFNLPEVYDYIVHLRNSIQKTSRNEETNTP